MDPIATMRRAVAQTQAVIDGVEPSQLDAPSPCAEWTVRDVINHVTAGGTMFAIIGAEGSISDEKLGELMTADLLGDDYKASFRDAAHQAIAAFSDPAKLDQVMASPLGELPGRVLVNIATFDLSTHAWDIAKATGQISALDPELYGVALELAQQMITPEMRAPGRLGPEVAVPADAPVHDRLAGLTGRTP